MEYELLTHRIKPMTLGTITTARIPAAAESRPPPGQMGLGADAVRPLVLKAKEPVEVAEESVDVGEENVEVEDTEEGVGFRVMMVSPKDVKKVLPCAIVVTGKVLVKTKGVVPLVEDIDMGEDCVESDKDVCEEGVGVVGILWGIVEDGAVEEAGAAGGQVVQVELGGTLLRSWRGRSWNSWRSGALESMLGQRPQGYMEERAQPADASQLFNHEQINPKRKRT
jgi:hypothetical protein